MMSTESSFFRRLRGFLSSSSETVTVTRRFAMLAANCVGRGMNPRVFGVQHETNY